MFRTEPEIVQLASQQVVVFPIVILSRRSDELGEWLPGLARNEIGQSAPRRIDIAILARLPTGAADGRRE